MPGERQFGGLGEDPHPGVAPALGGQEEHGLRQVELPGGPLHKVVVQAAPVREHRELVALKRGGSEHVGDEISVPGAGLSLGLVRP